MTILPMHWWANDIGRKNIPDDGLKIFIGGRQPGANSINDKNFVKATVKITGSSYLIE